MKSSSARQRTLVTALAALALASACGPATRRPPPPTPVAPLPGAVAPPPGTVAGAIRYRIDAARSDLRILVYRSGRFAALGHNHVLRARVLSGEVWLAADPALARFTLTLPVSELVVDEPELRREEGAEFASEPKPSDIDGTRTNLLGPAVLDGAAYPEVTLSGEGARGADGLVAHTTFQVRDRSLAFDVPVAVSMADGTLTAQGGFTVLQSALGLTPFSVALGALRVRDDLAVRFRLVAVSDPAGGGS